MGTDYLPIILTNIVEEAQHISRNFARKETTFKEANEQIWSLKNVLSGMRHDSKHSCTSEEAEALNTAIQKVCEIHNKLSDVYLSIQEAEIKLMREYRREVL